MSEIITESVEGQPAEVQDILSPLSQRAGPALVRGLKQQAVRVTRERDALAQELDNVRRSTRATRVAELEMGVHIYKEQLAQAAQVQQAALLRVQAAEARALDAENRSRATTAALHTYLQSGEISAPLAAPAASRSLSGRSKSRTLAALRSAHDTLIGQASQLRRAFSGSQLHTLDQLAAAAAHNPEVSGAAEVLRYLLVHLSGLAAELRQLPGASEIMRGPALYPAPGRGPSSGLSSSADADTSRGARHTAGGGDKQYMYPFPGPLPRQVSNSGDLVLGLMDQLHDLKALTRLERSQDVHPLFVHDMETVASLAAELSRELMRLKGASSGQQGPGQRRVSSGTATYRASASSLGLLDEEGEWRAEAGPCCDAMGVGPAEGYDPDWRRKARISDGVGEFDEEDVNT